MVALLTDYRVIFNGKNGKSSLPKIPYSIVSSFFLKALKMKTFVLVICLTVSMTLFAVSCKKDNELFEELGYVEQIRDVEQKVTNQIPSDFDWNNIPSDFGGSVWEIRDTFDLGGQTILLPKNVTLSFLGGVLTHGTVRGAESTIKANEVYQVFDDLTLQGSFKNEFLVPYWFGAVMDGATDDRDSFVETLQQATNIGTKVLIERDIFLDVEETGTKSIFLEDHTWIEGKNDSNIIINNLLSPAFYMVLTRHITIKDITFLYDNTYDAAFGWSRESNGLNTNQLKNYLASTKNIAFNSANPVWRGPVSFRAIFSVEAAENIKFDTVIFKAKGETADTFIQWAIKLKEQNTANQTVTSSTEDTDIPRNITLNNVTMDGVIMGIQGIVDGFKCEGLKSFRYTDVQDSFGNNIGGSGRGGSYWMPPPHLFYLNKDSSINYHPQNIEILNTVDYGEYVGSKEVRAQVSGYCNSLKLVDRVVNVTVDNYKSYRRDGLADIGDVSNGVFKNMYSENTSDIFDSTFKFNSLRFLGTLNNVSFENVTIKDIADRAEIYPLDVTKGNHVNMKNIHVYVNELKTETHGPFGVSGSNNTVINSSLNIENHTTVKEFRGVVFLDDVTRKTNGSSNYYDVVVKGWRDISNSPTGKRIRILLQDSSNPNSNYAKVTDVSNNLVIEQINEIRKDIWTRKEFVTLGQGTSHLLKIDIAKGFTLGKISTTTMEALAAGIEVSMGTSPTLKNDLIPILSRGNGRVSRTIHGMAPTTSNRSIYLYANRDFLNKGKIEVTLELVKSERPN